MAKIPLGDFGQAIPQSRATPTFSAGQLDGGMTDAAQRVGNTVSTIAENDIAAKRAEAVRLQREAEAARKAEAEKQARRAEQVATANATADIQVGLNSLTDELSASLQDGSRNKDEVRKLWVESSNKLLEDTVAKMPADLRDLTRAQMRGFAGGLSNKIEDGIRKRDQQDADAGLITFREKMERLAGSDMATAVQQWNTVVDGAGGSAGWSPEKIAKEKQSFQENVLFTRAYSLATAARRDNAALDALSKELSSPQFAGLDPQRKAQLEHTMEGYRTVNAQQAEIRAQRAERLEERRLKKAEASANAFQMVSDKGFAMDADYMAKTLKETEGTPYQATVLQLAKAGVATGGLAAQPIAQQRAAYDQVTQQIAREGATPALVKRRDQIEKVLNGSTKDAKDDGLRAYADRSPDGGQIKPLVFNGGMEPIVKGLAERREMAEAASDWSGRPTSPLTAEEIEPIRNYMASMKAPERAAFTAALTTAVGPRGARGLAAQLADKDRALELSIAAAGAQTTEGRYVSQLIFDGDQAIKDGAVMKDDKKVTGWRSTIASEVDGVFASERESAAVKDAAYLIAASIAKQNGGALKGDDLQRAVRLASGTSAIIERNGGRIPLPAGVDEDMLDKRLRSVQAVDVVPQGARQKPENLQSVRAAGVEVPMADFIKSLPGATLRAAGPGRYNVVVNDRLVTTADGKQAISIGAR